LISRIIVLCAVLIALAACSTAPAATSSPSPSVAPTRAALFASPAAEPTRTPRPTSEPTEPPATPVLNLWHPYAPDSVEAQTIAQLVERAKPDLPDVEIAVRAIPGDEIANRFEIEAAAGGGPDLLLISNDAIQRHVAAGLLRPLDDALVDNETSYAPNALDSLRVDGALYGLPLARSTVALYANTGQGRQPPDSTGALLDAVKNGARLVLVRSAYHNYGFVGAWGGRLFDDGGRCIADQGGFAPALAYLRELKAAGATFAPSGQEAEELFRSREADLTINGSWLRGDFNAALGGNLAVAAIPTGPSGPATPLIGSVALFVKAASQRPDDAIALALALTTPEAQAVLVEQTQQLPAVANVPIEDGSVAGLAAAAENGIARPQRPEMDAFWQPFDEALGRVLDTDVDPATAVSEACAAMNEANGK
jgi:arabinogalactan oligomer / maltooligosaccharide transport system substrate-binding protein